MTLNRAVLERMPRIIHQVPVVCRGNSSGKKIRIVRRLADQGEHFARSRIKRDDGAHLLSDGVFSGALEIEINGSNQVIAGNVGLFAQFLHLSTETVDHNSSKSVFSDEQAVVLAFEASLTNLITRF